MQTNKTYFCNNIISRPRAPLTATCSIVSSLADVHCMLALCRYQGSSLTYILNLQLINSLIRPDLLMVLPWSMRVSYRFMTS